MKIVRKNETREFKNSEQCIAIEYSLEDKDINGAVGKISGRYPETCTPAWYPEQHRLVE